MEKSKHLISIIISILFIIIALASGTEAVVYKSNGVLIFDNVKEDGDIIYNVDNGTLNIEGRNIYISDIDIYDVDIVKGAYDITKDIKRTDKFNHFCNAKKKGINVKVEITIAYTIYDYGYNKNNESRNGDPTWIYVTVYENGRESCFAQGPYKYF